MKKIGFYLLLVGSILTNRVYGEETKWSDKESYGPMPVLFIHGINANAETWDTTTEELEKYFQYKWKRFNGEDITSEPYHPVTYDEEHPTAPQNKVVKHYLEAFDYGGEDTVGSTKALKGNYTELVEEIEKVLKAYYGEDKWQEGKLILVGHSQGGLIARDYLQRNPDNAKYIKRLVTIGTPHYGSDWLANISAMAMQDPSLSPGTKPNWLGKIIKAFDQRFRNNIKAVERGDAAVKDLLPNSEYLKELNRLSIPKDIEYVCLVGQVVIPGPPFICDSDGIVKGYSQRAEKPLPRLYPKDPIIIEQKIPWDYIINLPGIEHTKEPKQYQKIFESLDGIPDDPDGEKRYYYDTPKITLGTYTFTPATDTNLYYDGSGNDFYITGKIYDYLPASCTISLEINNPDNYVIQNKPVSALNMTTESQEEPKTGRPLNARFNFKPDVVLSLGIHTFRLTIKNSAGLVGTATTQNGSYWIPFRITEKVVEVPGQIITPAGTVTIAGGFQAASSLYFWDNQNNYWERWINSNLRVDSDNIIRYNCGTSNLDNPNLRHRVYLESRIYPPASMYPKASCVNKKEMQAITYTYGSPPFKLLPFPKADNTVVYRPDVDDNGTITYPEDMVTFTNNEVIFTPKKDALPNLNFGPIILGNPMYTYPLHIIIPPEYQGVSSNELDIYINQVGGLYALESVQKAFDYSQSLSSQQGFNPTLNIAWAQEADLTNDGITGFGSNTAGVYRLLVNGDREDEFNEDRIIQAYGNALLTHYTNRQYGQGYFDYKLPIASITYTMSPQQAFVDGFCLRFSAAVRGSSIVELPIALDKIPFDISESTHRGTTSALGIAQALYRIPMKNIWQALENPNKTIEHSGYTILDLLDELDTQGYDTSSIRAEFFSTAMPTPAEILQKVAENFGKIEDMKAKMISWGSAGTKTFSAVERKLLFKKPDKMKFITPDRNRTVIINGDIQCEIDQQGTMTTNISDYADISERQLDIHYYLQEFKDKHNIVIIDHQIVKGNIYILEAIPKEPNIIYGRLVFYIDYDKGIDVKREVFSDDNILLVTKEITISELIKGIWIPTQYIDKMYFEDGVIETNTELREIELNIGISDEEFSIPQ
ncbi:MAG: alpha/beta fold hydrolase [bacterium]